MKRPHILDMTSPWLLSLCSTNRVDLVYVTPREHERHPERTCEACRAAYEGRK